MVAATPSGITLAPEGGAHQSIATPLIGMAQDGLASFEPAFVDELAVIMGWGFQHMQREGGRRRGRLGLFAAFDPHARAAAADHDAGPAKRHHRRRLLAAQARARTASSWSPIPARWRPRRSRRSACIGESRRDVGLLAVTSADRLHAGWTAARNLRRDRRGVAASQPYRKTAGAAAARLRHRHRDRRPSGDARLARQRARPPGRGARRRAFRPDRHHRRPLPPPRHRRQRHHRCRGKPSPPAPRCGTARWRCDRCDKPSFRRAREAQSPESIVRHDDHRVNARYRCARRPQSDARASCAPCDRR